MVGSCLCLILRCSFRIISILIRYVATISMKTFYDDETLLKIAFKTLLRFLAGINRLPTVFMQSVHRASRPHGFFYYSAHLAGILNKRFASFDNVCFAHRSGALCRCF